MGPKFVIVFSGVEESGVEEFIKNLTNDEQLVEYLQDIRDHFGKAVNVSSAYRCETHNKNVGGATGSRHMKGQAADIYINGVKPAEIAKYAESIGILGRRSRLQFKEQSKERQVHGRSGYYRRLCRWWI